MWDQDQELSGIWEGATDQRVSVALHNHRSTLGEGDDAIGIAIFSKTGSA